MKGGESEARGGGRESGRGQERTQRSKFYGVRVVGRRSWGKWGEEKSERAKERGEGRGKREGPGGKGGGEESEGKEAAGARNHTFKQHFLMSLYYICIQIH